MKHATTSRGHARVSPARTVQNGIRAIEANLDDTLAEGGALLAQMMEVNRLGRLAPHEGQAAIDATLACLTAVAESRARATQAHEGLREAVAKINLREMGWGDVGESPPVAAAPVPPTSLRVVRADG